MEREMVDKLNQAVGYLNALRDHVKEENEREALGVALEALYESIAAVKVNGKAPTSQKTEDAPYRYGLMKQNYLDY